MKRVAVVCFFSIICGLFIGISSAAAAYPEKSVNIVVLGSPGSGADTLSRFVAKISSKYFPQPLVVMNKPGGGGVVALSYLLSQPADGYNLMLHTRSLVVLLTLKSLPFTHKNFDYIARLTDDYFMLAVPGESPFKTFGDFVSAAKQNPNGLKVSGAPYATTHFLFYSQLQKAFGFKATWAPFDSSKDAIVNTLGGHSDAGVANPAAVLGFPGRLIPLGSSSPERIAENVPTFRELGHDVVESQWRGLIAKKGTPDNVKAALVNMLEKVLDDPEWKNWIEKTKNVNAFLTEKDFSEQVDREMISAKEVLTEAGLIKK